MEQVLFVPLTKLIHLLRRITNESIACNLHSLPSLFVIGKNNIECYDNPILIVYEGITGES